MAMYGQGKTRGQVSLLGIDAATNQACAALLPKPRIIPEFIYYYLYKQYENLRNLANDGSQRNLSAKLIKGFKVAICDADEQLKIADFLTAVDNKLTALRHKRELLQTYKRGMMQKLFSRALRFKSDDGSEFPEWGEKRLGEITGWQSGGTPSKQDVSYWGGDIPWISAVSMYSDFLNDSELKITDKGLASGSRLAKEGSILLLVRGSMLFKRIPVGMALRDVAFNQDVKALTVENGVDCHFLLYWFKAHENRLLSMVVGTGIGAGKLETGELKALEVGIPHQKEQQKIANFLSTIDVKIDAVGQQIDRMETFKKGLLQKMFV